MGLALTVSKPASKPNHTGSMKRYIDIKKTESTCAGFGFGETAVELEDPFYK